MLILYVIAIFLSATLLFAVQPLFARMILPLLGGSPGVWNTALVFYQAALLAGYAYAHFSTRWLGPRRQAALHLGLLLVPLLVLPIGIAAGSTPPSAASPIPWLLEALFMGVGLPFFVISATSPLLQRWFAASGHRHAADPYFLYGASNAGSMLALLSYPLLIEPRLRLQTQSTLWSWGYAALIILLAGCAVALWRRPAQVTNTADTSVIAPPIPVRRWGRWVLLALVPSALMSSVTTYLSTDIAAIPLLWVVPLVLYLLTFIIVFARRPIVPHWIAVRALPIVLLPLVIALVARATQPLELLIPLHLLVFFVITLVCHGELARDRPPVAQLTAFYLWMSLGGVLGSALVALVAPLLFNSVVEYPLMLVIACILAPARNLQPTTHGEADDAQTSVSASAPLRAVGFIRRRADLLLPIALGLLTAGTILVTQAWNMPDGPTRLALMFGVPTLLGFSLSAKPLRFGLGVGAIMLASQLHTSVFGTTLYAERSFFGVNRVLLNDNGTQHQLFHGSTLHGVEMLDPALQRVPTTYYYANGPIGQVFSAFQNHANGRSVAVVGLGTGSLACYRAPGQQWTYYEIDPAVVRIARDPHFFNYMTQCDPDPHIVLGDARLSLTKEGQMYHLLILDAYSSDSIPVHLLTREALKVYLARLNPGGLLAFHISNRHLNLEPVLATLAADAGLVTLMNDNVTVSPEDAAKGKWASQWVLLARSPTDFGPLVGMNGWQPARGAGMGDVWTDDYSSLLQVLSWR